MSDLEIPVFFNKSAKRPAAQLTLAELAQAMIHGRHGRLDFTLPKDQLPVAAFAAIFRADAKSKAESEVEAASGYVPLDADDLGSSAKAQEYHRQIVADPHTALAFISPSGRGVKALVLVRRDVRLQENYKDAWRQVAAHYSALTGLPALSPKRAEQDSGQKVPHIDSTGDNINRLAFLCQRDEIFLNAAAVPFEWELPAVAVEPAVLKPAVPVRPVAVPPVSGDRGRALAALQHIIPPVDAGGCYEAMRNAVWGGRDAGLDRSDLERWAAGYHRAGEIPQIWNDYRPGLITAGTFYYLARDSGWRGKLPAAASPPPVGLPVDPAAAGTLSDWYEVGQWLAGSIPEFRYDPERDEWVRWTDGSHWRFADGKRKSTPVSLEDRLRSERKLRAPAVAELSVKIEKPARRQKPGQEPPAPEPPAPVLETVLEYTEAKLNSQLESGIIAGLRRVRARSFPDYTGDQAARAYRQSHIAVPAGVVDLETGEIESHDPARHDTRAVTNGDYRPGDLAGLEELLQERLDPVFDAPEYSQWKSALGLMVSGRAQSHRSILVLQGPSGSGKGGTVKLMTLSLGKRAKTLKSRFLEETHNEIDADRYWLMCDQPLLLAFDELSPDSKINIGKVLSLTGDNVLPGARLPYQKVPLEDSIPSMIVLSLVEPPPIRRGTGFDRRVWVIPCRKEIPPAARDPRSYYSQDLLDAVVTVGIAEAMAVYRPGYLPPEPDAVAQKKLKDAADDIAGWVDELEADWEGRPVEDALLAFREETGSDQVTQVLFTRRVGGSDRWKVIRPGRGEDRVRRLSLKR